MNKKALSYIILLVCVIVTMIAILSNLKFDELLLAVKKSNIYYLLLGMLLMLLFWTAESIIMDVMIKRVVPNTSFWVAFKTTLIGQYYSYITPLASGGQPAQLYIMNKDDIPYSNGTAILVSKFILFQATVTIYSLLLGIFRLKLFLSSLKASYFFIILGFLINIIGLAIFIAMALNPNFLERITNKALNFLKQIRLIKNTDKWKDISKNFIHQYDEGIVELKKNVTFTLGLFIGTIIQLTIFFSITYCIYKALGLSGASIIDVITLQALLYITIAFIPTPGNTGAAEMGFALLMGTLFSGKLAIVAALLWRGISYYFGLIVCGIFTLLFTSIKYN